MDKPIKLLLVYNAGDRRFVVAGSAAESVVCVLLVVVQLVHGDVGVEVGEVLEHKRVVDLGSAPDTVQNVIRVDFRRVIDLDGVVGVPHPHDVPDDALELMFVELFVVNVVRSAVAVEDLDWLDDAVAYEPDAEELDLQVHGVFVNDFLWDGRALSAPPALLQLHVAFVINAYYFCRQADV